MPRLDPGIHGNLERSRQEGVDGRLKPGHDVKKTMARMTGNLARLVAAILFVLMPLSAALAEGFVAGTEDVPLMPGLAPVPGSSIVFDKPEGRIVEAQATGKVTRAAARAFYGASLPQLGWTAAGADAWRREGEVLRLDYREERGILTLGFTLSPQ